MSEPIDSIPVIVKEPEPWDLGAAPPETPHAIQEAAIEELLLEPIALCPLPADDLLAVPHVAMPASAPQMEANEYVEEFKPTAEEWENVKELEFPHAHQPSRIEVDQQPLYKPEILERDANGLDGAGDWTEVEPERTKE